MTLSATAATGNPTPSSPPAGARAGPRIGFSRGVIAIVVLALIVRIVIVVATPRFVPATDAADYDRIAVSLALHDSFPVSLLTPSAGPTAFRPPMFPIALGALYKVVGVGSAAARWRAGRLFEALLGTIVVALTGLIALRLWGVGIGLLSGAIAAVYPPLLLVGSSLMSESLFIPLALGGVLAALMARSSARPWRWAALAGVLIGLAGLTRSNGIVLLVAVALLVWTERPWRSWRALRLPLVVGLAAGLTLVPWTIRNADQLHAFIPLSTESGYALAGTYNAYSQHRSDYPAMWTPPVLDELHVLARNHNLNEAQIDSRLQAIGIDRIRAHPTYVLKTVWWNALRLLNLTGPGVERWEAQYEAYPPGLTVFSVYAFWLCAGLAVIGAATRAAKRAPLAFWAFPILILLSTMLFVGVTRYRSPADPFVVMLAALALMAAWPRLRAWLPSPAA